MNLAQPILRRKLSRRSMAEPLYGQFVEERFGRYTYAEHKDWIWIHAVSLGETRTAGILLKTLRETFPGMKLLLTNGTATGREEGQKLLQSGDVQVWQAWDSADAVSRFYQAFQPRIGLMMETEVWPNMVHFAAKFNVPLILVNARMSEKSMRQALRWPSLMCTAFNGLNDVFAQTQDDKKRLLNLGAKVSGVFGNLKFDAKPDAEQMLLGKQWRAASPRPVLMLASSREGEEQLWLTAWQKYLQKNPQVLIDWLIVPRHPQRVAEVEDLIQSKGLTVSRRSTWGVAGPEPLPADANTLRIFIGDSLGEMALYYSFAQAALLGGSFEKLGGQNLIEASACACPVVMGPHTFNFSDAAQSAESSGAALRVDHMDRAIEAACQLVLNPHQQAALAQNAALFAQAHGGATQRTANAVRERLSQIKDSTAR